jgi:hypothetical protein
MGAGNEAADGNERFDIGGGGELGFELDLASLWPNPLGLGYALGLEGGLLFDPYKAPASGNARHYGFGGVLGLYYFPLSRLLVRFEGAAGLYQALVEEGRGQAALWWRGGGELGFRFTPMFTLAAGGGWRQFQSGNGGVFNSGVYAGLALHITFESGNNLLNEGSSAVFVQDEGVYPAFLSLYQKSPAGAIVIRNNENAEIRNVRVSFRAASYTSSEFPCGTVALIPKGRSVELPLYADFSPDLLRFTDTGRILGEVVIRYRFLGKERESAQTLSIRTHNRNVFPQGDASALAAFVSPTSPEILQYARHITGLARSNQRTGLNGNMQTAVWLLEGLRAGGIRLDDTHAAEGEAQFPAETLGFRTGGPTDLGLLYAAALEASGISAALVPLVGDFVVACYLGVDRAGAELLFNSLDRVLVIDDEVWLPLSMAFFNEGFMAAWEGGVSSLNEVFAEGSGADFIVLENAWGTYPPAPLPAQGGAAVRAGEEELASIAKGIILRYVDRDIQPLVLNLQQQLSASPTAALYNRLGILLVRSGRTTDAKAAYERAAAMGSVPAMTNRGNLALIERDYPAAERWFKQALTQDPANSAAQRGLEKIEERRE